MRLYQLLLRLYPASFRGEYGGEMMRIFARRHRDASGAFARVWLWLEVLADTMANAARVHIEIVRQDLRHTIRTLRRTPGFAITAIVVTALGVGATTAAFSVADHVLLRPLPFAEPDRLVKIWQGDANRGANLRGLQNTNDVSPANYRDWKALSSSFSAMGAYAFVSSNLVGRGEPERLDGAGVTPDALAALGVLPAMGRAFGPADDVAGAPGTVIISDAFWHRKFGADPTILGQKLMLDDEPCVVIGVMPRGFDFPTRSMAFWRPIRFRPASYDDRTDTYLRVIARLQTGVSWQRAASDLAQASAALARMYPKDNTEIGAVMIQLRDELNDQSRVLLFALVAASACVLLIACTNLASLLVARATARGRELAVRTAMGAGRDRLIRQLLTESLLIACIGGVLGVLLAMAAVTMAVRLVPTSLPIAEAPSVDLRMLGIAALITLGTGLGFGVLPAFRAARQASAAGLREGARAGASRQTERVRTGLVVAQVGTSVVLLVCAGLLIRALWQVQAIDPGFKADGVLTMRTTLPWAKYGLEAKRAQFYRAVVDEVKGLPGVTAAAYTSFLPMTMRGGIWRVTLPGRAPDADHYSASARFVTPDYFHVMGISLKAGRALDESDAPNAEPATVVSASFVRKYLSNTPAIGSHFKFAFAGERTIVGIVGDVRVRGLERDSEPQVYLPYQQQADDSTLNYMPKDLVVRMAPGAPIGGLTTSIRQIIAKADPYQPVSDVQPLSAIVQGETSARASQVTVLSLFAGVACLLAAIGLHGLLAFVVSARRREFGVRLALGATPVDIVRMVAWRGVRLAAIGVALGVGLAYVAGRSMQALLVGLSPGDLPTLAVAVGTAIGMTLLGSLIPALRAGRTDPADALRDGLIRRCQIATSRPGGSTTKLSADRRATACGAGCCSRRDQNSDVVARVSSSARPGAMMNLAPCLAADVAWDGRNAAGRTSSGCGPQSCRAICLSCSSVRSATPWLYAIRSAR